MNRRYTTAKGLAPADSFKEPIIFTLVSMRTSSLRFWALALLTIVIGSGSLVVAQDRRSEQVAAKGATDETVLFFERNAVTDLKLTIDQEGQESLRQTPRDYTRCTSLKMELTRSSESQSS